MKSELIENVGLKKKLKISVTPEEVAKALDVELQKIQKTAHLKGFRKGKAPMEQIKAAYGGKASQSVLETLVNDNYISALKEHDLTPIVMPKIDMDQKPSADEEKNGGFTFTAEFEVRPEITLKSLSEIKVKAPSHEVKDEDVTKELEIARAQKAEVVAVFEERPAKEKDWVKIDFAGTMTETGKALDNGTANDFLLELGSNSLIPGFEDGILGMKVGAQKTLSLNFPEDYFQKEIAGKGVDFLVTLKSINKKDLPELNDEFAKEMAGVDSLQAFKDQIKERLETQAKQKAEAELNTALLVQFEEIHDIDIPQTLVDEQVRSLKMNTEQRLIQQGMPKGEIEDYHSKWEDNYKTDAIKGVKTSFLVESLARQEKLQPTPEDITSYFADLSDKTNIAMDKIKSYYAGPEKQSELEFKLMEEKVLSYLKDNATIEA